MKQPFIFALLATALVSGAPAQAQTIAADLLPPYEVSTIVASMGMRPLDRPVWRNGRYVVAAIDRNGREVRVVLDAFNGQVIAVRPRMRDYVYEPRYAPPPPDYPRQGVYESERYGSGPYGQGPRYDDRRLSPPAAIPGRPSDDDDDDYFDNDRQQGSLTPPPSASREPPTGSVPRRVAAVPPVETKPNAAKDATPVPRPRPALAKANDPSKPAPSDTRKPDAREASNAKPATTEAPKTPTSTPKTEMRVIDLGKPKTDEKPEDKPGEAIRF